LLIQARGATQGVPQGHVSTGDVIILDHNIPQDHVAALRAARVRLTAKALGYWQIGEERQQQADWRR